MSSESQSRAGLKSRDDCGVCGRPLTYATESVAMRCAFCGAAVDALIHCPEGHFVCDSCHGRDALATLRQVLGSTTSTDPVEILELVMSHPRVPMHGPEHHAFVPAAIVAAVRNAGHPVPEDAVEKAIARGAKVPGGWCGSHGVCGAAVGVGIAVSVLVGATPLTGEERALANEATGRVLSAMLDGHPRCCKRAGRRAIEVAVELLKEKLGISLAVHGPIVCTYAKRNKQCPEAGCPYHESRARHAP